MPCLKFHCFSPFESSQVVDENSGIFQTAELIGLGQVGVLGTATPLEGRAASEPAIEIWMRGEGTSDHGAPAPSSHASRGIRPEMNQTLVGSAFTAYKLRAVKAELSFFLLNFNYQDSFSSLVSEGTFYVLLLIKLSSL